jgi:signal transduction histidine kinase
LPVKSPVATINSYNKIAQKIITGPDQAITANTQNTERLAVCYDTIEKNCQLLHHIIDELLDLTKIQNAGNQIPKETVNIVEITQACSQAFMPQAAENQLTLTVEAQEDCLHVLANTEKLTQALNNLLSNAIKYTDTGTITVSIKRHWNHQTAVALIEIIDTGIGIATEDLSKIFEPFNKIEHKTIKPIDSHGLGLSIAKGIIEMFGGNIKVYSNVGVGSRFCIKLPLIK